MIKNLMLFFKKNTKIYAGTLSIYAKVLCWKSMKRFCYDDCIISNFVLYMESAENKNEKIEFNSRNAISLLNDLKKKFM